MADEHTVLSSHRTQDPSELMIEVANAALEQLREDLDFPLGPAERIGGDQSGSQGVADATLKMLIRDRSHRPRLVLLCSSPVAPDLVKRNVERAALAKQALGAAGEAVLTASHAGEFNGISFAAFPYCTPLRDGWAWRLQRCYIRPAVLRWLQDATAATVRPADVETIKSNFTLPLEYLESLKPMPGAIREMAAGALKRLDHGSWLPHSCLMHGDLWKGNLLLSPHASDKPRFVVIDWPGSLLQGYGIYDLIRLADSLGVRGRKLHSHIASHCQLLQCDLTDSKSHLLAALAHIAMHLENFPLPRYISMSRHCLGVLDSVID